MHFNAAVMRTLMRLSHTDDFALWVKGSIMFRRFTNLLKIRRRKATILRLQANGMNLGGLLTGYSEQKRLNFKLWMERFEQSFRFAFH